MRIDSFSAPLSVAWQLTRRCQLECRHCLHSAGPKGEWKNELSKAEALRLASDCVACGLPYAILAGGEPMLSPHFCDVAETLGRGGVWLKVETNCQAFRPDLLERLSRLPIRSIQVSLDGATQETYEHLRPGASLDAVLGGCRLIRRLGMPLEVTFAPTRATIRVAEAVLGLAVELGAFRFSTGRLMRLGRAEKHWTELCPGEGQYRDFLHLLSRKERELSGKMELAFRPFSLRDQLREELAEPPGTLVILPDGKVKISPMLGAVCADLRKTGLAGAWDAYRRARRDPGTVAALESRAAGLCSAALARSIDLARRAGS